MPPPTIDELTLADEPEAWRALGFDVRDDTFAVGKVQIHLAGSRDGGIVACSMRGIAGEVLDGLPISRSSAPARTEPGPAHPNGTVALEHLVVVTPSLERTIVALEDGGLELRRVRDAPAPGGAPRQAFFRLGEVILEVAEEPRPAQEDPVLGAPARFWGLAFLVEDLDHTASWLGDRLGEPRDAVQAGRRIATLRRDAGASAAVAFITPRPRPR